MSPKIYRFAIGFFLVLTAVALTALYHVVEESVFFSFNDEKPVDIFPIITLFVIGVAGSITFSVLKRKKSRV